MKDTHAAWVLEFRKKHGQPVGTHPSFPHPDLYMEELDRVWEEFGELQDACEAADDLEHIAKEMADCIVVVNSLALLLGINLDRVTARVTESNMTKDPGPGGNGKVLKGPNYKPPFLADIIYPEELERC